MGESPQSRVCEGSARGEAASHADRTPVPAVQLAQTEAPDLPSHRVCSSSGLGSWQPHLPPVCACVCVCVCEYSTNIRI